MIKVNLIFPEYVEKLKQKAKNTQMIAIMSAVALLVCVITVFHIHKANATEKLMNKKETELKKLQDKVDKVNKIEKTKKNLAEHLKALEELLDKRFDYPYFMQDAARTISETVRFNNFKTDYISEGVVDFEITAQTYTGDDIGKWIKNLEVDEKFSDITLGAIGVERSENSRKEVFNFPVRGIYYARPKARKAMEEAKKKAQEAARMNK